MSIQEVKIEDADDLLFEFNSEAELLRDISSDVSIMLLLLKYTSELHKLITD